MTFIITKYGMHLIMTISGCMCNRKLLYKATQFYWTYRVWWRTGSVRSITRRWRKGCNRPAPCTNIRSTQHYEGIEIKGEREKFDVITHFGQSATNPQNFFGINKLLPLPWLLWWKWFWPWIFPSDAVPIQCKEVGCFFCSGRTIHENGSSLLCHVISVFHSGTKQAQTLRGMALFFLQNACFVYCFWM